MRVIFMGTPDFAVPSLQRLIDRGDDVCAVFTQPDRPKGRGHKLAYPPVKELAIEHSIPVYQPNTLRSYEPQELIRGLAPELIVVAAYGKILPRAVLETPKYGCINVHASLLPKYRGAAPIQWAVINGDKLSGVTTMLMAEGTDTGDILLKAETPIGEDETSGELFDRLKMIGAGLLDETVGRLESGSLVPIPQNEAEATKAPMLSKEMSALSWEKPARELHNLIRGLNPWPSAAAIRNGKRLKLFSSKVVDLSGEPGKLADKDGELLVFCGEGALIINELQTENGKRMSGKEYLLGHPLGQGEKFDLQ